MAVSRKKTTKTKTTAKRKTTRRVSRPFDIHLPVSLRLRGLTNTIHIEPPRAESVAITQKQHIVSQHVLQLRREEIIVAQIENVSRQEKNSEQTFDEFAQEFFSQLDSGEIFAKKEDAEIKVEEIDELTLREQLSEDDSNTSKKHFSIRIKSPRLPSLRLRLPLLRPSLRGISVFVFLSFVFVLPLQAMNSPSQTNTIKNQVIANSANAMSAFEKAADATSRVDFQSAKQNFEDASYLIEGAQKTLGELNVVVKILASIIPSKQSKDLKTGKALLDMGKELAISAERISDGLIAISNLADTNLGTKIEVLERYVESAIPHISSANEALLRVNEDSIPDEFRQTFLQLSQNLPQFEIGLRNLQTFSSALNTVLGNNQKQRYLFVFQNDSEIRPTGGFIGSFAEVDIYRGEIEAINLPGDGSYNLQGRLRSQVSAPKPLQLVNARWEFQDANWFPDFKASAEKLLWFHNQAGGPTMDGVIAINASFVADLLELVGPIDMPEYGRVITADNFLLETQKIVEVEYDKTENKPKQFLSDLAPKLIDRLTQADKDVFMPLLTCLSRGLERKDIQLYFTNTEAQKAVSELGWTGEVSDTIGDYLMVVDANIGGQKTDAVIDENVEINSEIFEDGTIRNTVTVTRQHHGIPGARFTGANNVDYIQLLVPRGSELIDVSGAEPPDENLFETPDTYLEEDEDMAFIEASSTTGIADTEISEMFGKTVFGNWVQTKPGQKSVISFTYELPWKIEWAEENDSLFEKAGELLGISSPIAHTLTIDSQSGARARAVNAVISFPAGKQAVWSTSIIEDDSISSRLDGSSSGFLAVLFDE